MNAATHQPTTNEQIKQQFLRNLTDPGQNKEMGQFLQTVAAIDADTLVNGLFPMILVRGVGSDASSSDQLEVPA